MYSDDKYRSFLLGMADDETEVGLEAGILDGSIDLNHLVQIEEELIDDHVFGRLSPEEERIFRSRFLSTPEPAGKLKFARAMHRYSVENVPKVRGLAGFSKLRGFAMRPWFSPLTGALSLSLLVASLWLGERNLRLKHELAQSTDDNNERQRVIDFMVEEQKRRPTQPEASQNSIRSKPAEIPNPEEAAVQPYIRLSPGVTRGLATVQVLHLDRQARTVSIALEIPFNPVNSLREELLSSEGKIIWSQQFSSAEGISSHGVATIVLPAGLLITGDYRFRVDADPHGEHAGATATYLFRVRND